MSPIETIHWERIRDRAPDSLADLYDGFAGAMFSLALEILGDRWEAEDNRIYEDGKQQRHRAQHQRR